MEGLIPVLSRVEVVGAGRVGAESHVGQSRVGVLFEKLKPKVKTFLYAPFFFSPEECALDQKHHRIMSHHLKEDSSLLLKSKLPLKQIP